MNATTQPKATMEYTDFIKHIESLEEYKELRERIHPYKKMKIIAPIIFRVDVTLTWGENEATVKDIEKDFFVWDDKRIIFSDLYVQQMVAEQKNAVKAYLKDLKALVKREAKKTGILGSPDFEIENAIHVIA